MAKLDNIDSTKKEENADCEEYSYKENSLIDDIKKGESLDTELSFENKLAVQKEIEDRNKIKADKIEEKKKQKLEKQKLREEKKKNDNRTFEEKAEDALDEVMGGLQDALYGPGGDYTDDIPATIETPSGIRKVIDVQTRRNFNKRILTKKGLKIFLIVIGVLIALQVLVFLITFFGGLFAK